MSEIFKYLSYACHNASHLLLTQLCLILLELRMGPIIGNVRELDHLSGTINHDFNWNPEFIIDSALPIDVDKGGISVDLFNLVDSNAAEVIHLSW